MLNKRTLKVSELHYRRVFEAAEDGILILNPDTGEIEDANPFMSELLGYTHDQFLGRHLWEIGLFKDIEQSKTAFCELQEKGYIRYEDMPLQDKNGVHREVEFVSNVYKVGEGKAIQCNIRDITKRKLAEKQLAYFSAIVNASQDAIIGKSLKFIVTSWNMGAEHLYGYTAEEVIGKSIGILQPGDRPDELPSLMARVSNGESTDNFHTIRRRKDGTLIDVSLTLSPIMYRSGQIIGVSTIARNITAAIRLERQLQEQAKQLTDEARNKDEFLAMLAHELRNPLAPIHTGIDVLRILPPNGEQFKQILNMMEEQIHNLVRLIDDLLDVSRCNRGKLELRRQQVELTKIITNAIQTAQPHVHANGHELSVTQAGENTAVSDGAELHGNIPALVHGIIPAVETAKKSHPDAKGDALVSAAIEANVWQSINDLLKKSPAVLKRVQEGKLKIVGAVYNLEDGHVNWLGEHPEQALLLKTNGNDSNLVEATVHESSTVNSATNPDSGNSSSENQKTDVK